MRMQIRILQAGDATVYQSLRLRGLRECPSAFASSFEEEAATPIDVVAARLAKQQDGATFGAFENDLLVGIVGLRRESMRKLAHKAYIWGMFVAPDARNGGVGRQLLAHALEYAGEVLRVRQVNLGVNADNLPAIALYRRMRFEPFGRERGFMLLDGKLHDEVHMACLLPTRNLI